LEHQAMELLSMTNNLADNVSASPTMALVDPQQITHVFNNLIANAIRYTPEGGRVIVSTNREEVNGRAWATVAVADTGIGIPEEELSHIFERFFRGEKPRKMQVSGTGLGLTIVKEIVELHGGRVTVESQVDEGSTFTIWLPLALNRDTTLGRGDDLL
jgi:signal transduction histidine kinase